MNIRLLVTAASAVLALGAIAADTSEKDVFAFIPPGGRTLFAQALANRPIAGELQAMLAQKRTRDEWVAYLRTRPAPLPAAQKLSDTQLQTLADYMAYNLPLEGKPPSSPTAAAWEKALPWDGREMALEKCQGCHIITVVVTQNRTREAWLGTMGKPSHVQIKLSRAQREQLANYLVLNGGIPIDDVPPELRAGGASY